MRALPRLLAFSAVLAISLGVAYWIRQLPPPPKPDSRPLRVIDPPSPRLPWLGPRSATVTPAPDLARSLPPPSPIEGPARSASSAREPQPAEIVPPHPLPGRAPSPELLRRATAALEEARELQLGPYATTTDVRDEALLRRLDGLAQVVEDAYRRRYGLVPVGEAREAVVLYRRESDYRRLAREDARIAALGSAGHTAQGLVLLYAGGRADSEVGATLVHELVHLLNRRSLGPALPPWLDEGLAEDLAMSRATAEGQLQTGTLGGSAIDAGDRIDLRGGFAAALTAQRALDGGRLPRVQTLLDSPWDEFVNAGRDVRYDAACFLVRYLLDGEGGAMREAFRGYLAAVAAGGPVEGEELRRRLDRPWPLLDLGWHAWLRSIDVRALAAEQSG